MSQESSTHGYNTTTSSSNDSGSSHSSSGSDARTQLNAISQACIDRGAVLNKKDDFQRRDGQRSNTWSVGTFVLLADVKNV